VKWCVVGILAISVYAQPPGLQKSIVAPSSYLTPGALPPNAREYLPALGKRLQVPGSERVTLIGTATDAKGTGPAQFIWELPGNLRLDRQTSPGGPLVYQYGAKGPAAGTPQADADLIESLASDSHEAFLVSFAEKTGHRLLATHLRVPTGSPGPYQGPFYDVFEVLGPVAAAGNSIRQKWYFFDDSTRLLAKTRYLIRRNGADITVECQYSNWTTQQGQTYPRQIRRTENGTAVFTLTVNQGVISPAVGDGIFNGH